MPEDSRLFEVADPFGRTWTAEFRWLQNAISIRHADAVDLKYYLSCGEVRREIVIALPHPELGALALRANRKVTDAWCLHLASRHLEHMLATGEDMDKPIVTLPARVLTTLQDIGAAEGARVRAAQALRH